MYCHLMVSAFALALLLAVPHAGHACIEPTPWQRDFSCSGAKGASAGLCRGAQSLLRASCDELRSVPFLAGVVERVGLVPDRRGSWLYGNASRFMLTSITGAGGSRVGLWQDPLQIASALAHVARSELRVATYVEVGVYTAWTCCLMAAFLRRAAAGLPPARKGDDGGGAASTATSSLFAGAAVDITKAHISSGTSWLLRKLNVSILTPSNLPGWLHAHTARRPQAERSPANDGKPATNKPLADLCFVDGNHSTAAVRHDYERLAPKCRHMLFHDIQDLNTLRLEKRSGGGVPSLWEQVYCITARRSVSNPRVVAHTAAVSVC